jgi:hypothetical protein
MTITISNNSDGSFTVSCGNETVIIGRTQSSSGGGGAAANYPRFAGGGGGVAANIVDAPTGKLPGKHVDSIKDILDDLLAKTRHPSLPGSAQVFEYGLQGRHDIDVGEITKAVQDQHGPDASIRIFLRSTK